MRTSSIITLALFVVFLLIVLIWLVSQDRADEQLEGQMKLAQLRHAIGLFIAAAAALFLLLRSLAGDAPGRLLALVLTFLAGVLLIEPSWGVALGLAAIAAAVALRSWGLGSTRRPLPTTPHETPPVL